MLEVSAVAPQIIRLTFKDQVEMTTTLVRFQEHYESPGFRGKYFTKAEFDAWYNETYGSCYYTYWAGFNIPSYILIPFLEGKFDPLSEEEKLLLSAIPDLENFARNKGYIVAALEGDEATYNHELAHAFYGTDPSYRTEVDLILGNMDEVAKVSFAEALLSRKYAAQVVDDETHAYIGLDLDWLVSVNWIPSAEPYREVSIKLREVFERYSVRARNAR